MTTLEKAKEFLDKYIWKARPASVQGETQYQTFWESQIPACMTEFADKITADDKAEIARLKDELAECKVRPMGLGRTYTRPELLPPDDFPDGY